MRQLIRRYCRLQPLGHAHVNDLPPVLLQQPGVARLARRTCVPRGGAVGDNGSTATATSARPLGDGDEGT